MVAGQGMGRRIALAVILVATIPAHARENPQVPDEAWADGIRAESLAAAPEHEALTARASALLQAGWSPYFPVPPVDLERGEVVEFDWGSGAWRRAGIASWLARAPVWRPIFALSTLAARDGRRFQPRPWNNLLCRAEGMRCLIAVTDRGFDEVRWLEIDAATQTIPVDGFDLPAGRSQIAWFGQDSLLVASPEAGRANEAGYALTARLWRRGQDIGAAPVVFEAPPDSGLLVLKSFRLANEWLGIIEVRRGIVPAELQILGRDGRARPLGLPPGSEAHAVAAGQLVVSLTQDWTHRGRLWPGGSVLSFDAAALVAGRSPQPRIVLGAGPARSLDISPVSATVQATANAAYLAVLEGGTRALYRATLGARRWRLERILGAPGKTARLIAADATGSAAFGSLEGMLEPATLYRIDGAIARPVRSGAPLFDAGGLTVERHAARAADGVLVPYWLVRRAGVTGAVPTILHGYGASATPTLPIYAPDVGRLWLEDGGAYVLAQVRGGGEYGVRWARAGQGPNRARPLGDFIAVAEDLVRRGIATPRQLGIDGGSDGGRLVAGAAMLRPDLFGAAVSRDGAVFPTASIGLAGSPVLMEDLRLIETEAGRALADAYWPDRLFDPRRGCPNLLLTSWRGDQRVSARQSRALAFLLRQAGCNALLFEQQGGEHMVTTPEMLGLVYGYFRARLGLRPR